MAKTKKVVTEKPVEKKVFSKEEIETALQIVHQEYFLQVMALSSHDPDLKELTFSKVSVSTPDGGVYLVSILHVEGPKVNLRKLAELADEAEKKS